MEKGTKQFYLVDFQVLPSALKNTIRAKELLKNGTAETINEAVKRPGSAAVRIINIKIM